MRLWDRETTILHQFVDFRHEHLILDCVSSNPRDRSFYRCRCLFRRIRMCFSQHMARFLINAIVKRQSERQIYLGGFVFSIVSKLLDGSVTSYCTYLINYLPIRYAFARNKILNVRIVPVDVGVSAVYGRKMAREFRHQRVDRNLVVQISKQAADVKTGLKS